jgi:FlaG/FlaF family flagellin (archaellin)
MTPRRWIRIAIVITLGAALATLPALPAVSQQAPATVEIGDTATLAAGGAGLLVTVTVTCPADTEFADLFVSVSQRRGSRTANANAFRSGIDCTGEPQEITLAATAFGATFRQGVAFATAELYVCDPEFFCYTVTDAEEITIVRAA